MLKATQQRFTGTGAKTSAHQSNGINKQQQAQIISQETKIATPKAHVNQLPTQQQIIVRKQIQERVTQKVVAIVKKDNHEIKRTGDSIAKHTKSRISQAFLVLYQHAFPFAISFIFVALLFYRRKDYLAIIKHDVKIAR